MVSKVQKRMYAVPPHSGRMAYFEANLCDTRLAKGRWLAKEVVVFVEKSSVESNERLSLLIISWLRSWICLC
jgi:hypothetical protein